MAKKTATPNTNEIVSAIGRETGFVPPQVVELEEAVLGALMLEKDAVFTVQDLLTPESFYKDTHQLIYQAILDLSAKLEPIDLYTVGQMLQRKDQLGKVGGPAYLAALTQKVGSAAHIEYHAKIIAQKYIQRELIRASSDIQRSSFDDSMDVNDLIDFAEGEIFKVSEGHVKRDVQKSGEIVSKAMKLIEEASEQPDGMSGVPSGSPTWTS